MMAAIRPQAELARLREEFRARADEAFSQMFGSDGQNGLVTFTEREGRACEATDALARWLMEEHLVLDSASDPGAQVDCPICGRPVPYDSPEQAELETREFQTRRGKIEYERAARRCPSCRKVFSLLDERLRLGTEGYSPRLLQKIEYAGANEESFQQAAKALAMLAELSISAKHVQRIAERLGAERRRQRDAEVAAFQAGTLKPKHPEPPEVVAVHLDAGKIQLREEHHGPGVRGPHWGDSKVGCFLTYAAISGDSDPQPNPPAVFLDPPRVMRLCREMERVRNQPQTSAGDQEAPLLSLVTDEHPEVDRPERLVRTAVATMESVEPFGWMVAAEAMRRGFYEAKKQAVLGDGGNWIGPLAELHFPGWTQILDFLHLLVHLYAAATAAYRGQAKAAWSCYERWVRSAWAGRVDELIAGLPVESVRLGQPPPKAPDNDPRRIVSLTLEYVKTNAERMDYASYRRAGLPISSAPVESLIKQFNQRVKGTEKFWLTGGVESVLQVRAAYLSEDDRAERFHDHRPRGPAAGRNRLRPAA